MTFIHISLVQIIHSEMTTCYCKYIKLFEKAKLLYKTNQHTLNKQIHHSSEQINKVLIKT